MAALTVTTLIQALQDYLAGFPEDADTVVGVAKDPEGNGFSVITGPERLFGTGKIEAWGKHDLDGARVVVIWPGYPQFDLGEEGE